MDRVDDYTAKISVFAETPASDDQKVVFIEYVHRHLLRMAKDLVRERQYACEGCGNAIGDRDAIDRQRRSGKNFVFCSTCGQRVQLDDVVERRIGSDFVAREVRRLDDVASEQISNQAREQVLFGHIEAIVGEANQIWRDLDQRDHGIDGEIEFRDWRDNASGRKVYVQLKYGDSYLRRRASDDKVVFDVQNPRHIEYWQNQPCDVYLVIETSAENTRWMNLTQYLRRREDSGSQQIIFHGERLDASAIWRVRDRLIGRDSR